MQLNTHSKRNKQNEISFCDLFITLKKLDTNLIVLIPNFSHASSVKMDRSVSCTQNWETKY